MNENGVHVGPIRFLRARTRSLLDAGTVAKKANFLHANADRGPAGNSLKGKKPMIDPNSSDPSSATPEFTSEQFYGMPTNSFPGRTPPPSSVYTAPAGPVSPTGQTDPIGQTSYPTGQIGYSGMVPSPMPLETIPSLAAPSRTNELSIYTPPRTTTVAGGSRGSGPNQGLIPTSTQMMTYGNTNAHHHYSDFYTRTHYQADLLKFKEDLANAIKSKLGVDMGSSRLYQKPYPPEFDFVSYLAGWHISEFTKFNDDDSRTTWEHISQYIL